MLCGDLNGKKIKKRGEILPDLLCCRANTKTTLQSNYSPIKFLFVCLFVFLLMLLILFFFKLYSIVLVLPNIEMNPPQIYLCSPS